jgi:hypothetical protein
MVLGTKGITAECPMAAPWRTVPRGGNAEVFDGYFAEPDGNLWKVVVGAG